MPRETRLINNKKSFSSGLDESFESTDSSELGNLNNILQKKSVSEEKFHRKFVIAPEIIGHGAIFNLRHPKFCNSNALFHFNKKNSEIFEILDLNDFRTSIFYGETLIGNGGLTILSPIHPLFLALYYLLKNAQNRFIPLDLIFDEEEEIFLAIRLLIQNRKFIKSLEIVTDFKEIDSEQFYKYNEQKLIRWLEIRFNILLKSLTENGLLHKDILNDKNSLRRYTFGIFCDYLPECLAITLKNKLEIKEPLAFVAQNTIVSKRSCDKSNENLPQKKSKPSSSSASKRLQEASKGTKSLMSFFSQKKE